MTAHSNIVEQDDLKAAATQSDQIRAAVRARDDAAFAAAKLGREIERLKTEFERRFADLADRQRNAQRTADGYDALLAALVR